MENLIKFFDFKSQNQRGVKKLVENEISVWYNSKNKNYCCTLNNGIQTDKPFVKIGKLGDSIVIVFTDEQSLRVQRNGDKKRGLQNLCFNSKEFTDLFFPNYDKIKDRKIFKVQKINNDIYSIIS
jgi:hypothetical protein